MKNSLDFVGSRKLVHRFLLRRGEFWVFGRSILETNDLAEVLKLLKGTSGEIDVESFLRFQKLEANFVVERRCLYNLEEEINEICREWGMVC